MPEKKPINKEITEEDIVRLKPILGIQPGKYLAFLYGLIILVILFFILLFPGLSKPGTVLVVKSEPAGAAVRVDGVFMNAAPCEIFVPKGKHQIEVVLPGFTDWRGEMEFGSRAFGSLFFPAKTPLQVELKSPNPNQAFIAEAAEFAAWTFAGEANLAYQIPMTLSDAAYRLGPAARDPFVRQGLQDTLFAAAGFANTRSGLRDLVRAKFLLDNQGLAASPLSLLSSLEDIIAFLDKNPEAAAWLAETLTGEPKYLVEDSAWFRNATQNLSAPLSIFGSSVAAFGNLRFREIISTTEQPGFYIAEAPLSIELWELFLAEKPEWRKENLSSLMQNGLVDSQYLANYKLPGQPENTAIWVSWFAAKAWCEWYGSKINAGNFFSNGNLPAGTVVELRLPTEAEWELAAKAGMARVGEFWEWCENPYAQINFVTIPSVLELISPQRPVRGGSWVNARNSINPETRGSLLPESCSPFVSFRPIMALKRN